jgi:hypothetical protein
MSLPSLRVVPLPPCLPLGIKDSLKEDVKLFVFAFGLWALGFWLFDGEDF